MEPASSLVPTGAQLFIPGVAATVVSGSPGQEAGPTGAFWWLTSETAAVAVLNGTRGSARVVVTARVAAPCQDAVRVTFAIPGRRSRTVTADQAGTSVRFAVRVPQQGVVTVPLDVATDPCQPPADARTLYAGLFELTAMVGRTPTSS